VWWANVDGFGDFQLQQILKPLDYFGWMTLVELVDLDRDGDLDLLSGTWGTGSGINASWFENATGAGDFMSIQPVLEAVPLDVLTAADLDGDGARDVVLASATDDLLGWCAGLSTGEGGFGSVHVVTGSTVRIEAVRPADLDSDADPDLLVSTAETMHGIIELAWYRNVDASGSFTMAQQIGGTGSFWPFAGMDAADLDGDGDTDVLDVHPLRWFPNVDGAGSFGAPVPIDLDPDDWNAVLASDLDGDGDPDLAASEHVSWPLEWDWIRWYENVDGQAHFAARSVDDDAVATAFVARDLDGDGDADLLAAVDGGLAWYANTDGQGAFGPRNVVMSGTWPVAIDALDLDGDDERDLLWATGDLIAWHENLGSGTFGAQQTIASDTGAPCATADLDGDGDADLLGSRPGELGWLENDGLAGFGTWHSIATLAASPKLVVAADLDGDADPDALWAIRVGGGGLLGWFANEQELPLLADLGHALAGSHGEPLLVVEGHLVAGTPLRLSLSQALEDTATALVVGASPLMLPFKGGLMVPALDLLVLGLVTDGSGQLELVATWPPGVPPGQTVLLQCWIVDAGGPAGFAASNGVSGAVP
jgi:hypothetical protein